MQTIRVKELMVPLADYATVPQEATLYEAVLALDQARERFDPRREKHRAILVLDRNRRVVGKVGYLELLAGLEPNYSGIPEQESAASTFTPDFIRSQLAKYSLWQKPLDDICRKAARHRVKDIMHVPGGVEFIDAEASLDEAVHQLVTDRRQSLMVRRGDEYVGILRLSDVVGKVCELIKACPIDAETP
jgi:CBS-domain-containing membrane protein